MELYRRARGVLPSVFTFIRTVDQKKTNVKCGKYVFFASPLNGLVVFFSRLDMKKF
jgi:hypothetical protein